MIRIACICKGMANSVIFALLLFILSWCCVVVVAAAQLQWLRWLICKLLRHNNHPPGPFPIPVLGNLHLLVAASAPHRYLAELARKYGPVFHLQLGIVPTVVVSTPSAAQQVLLAHDKSLASRPDFHSAGRLLYGADKISFLCPYNDRWRSIRKFYSLHMFNPRQHQDLHLPVVRREILRSILGHLLVASRSGSHVNLSNLFYSLVQNIMYRIVLDKLPAERDEHNFLREMERLLSVNRIGEFLPFLSFLDHRLNGAMDRWHRYTDAVLEGIIEEREREILKTRPAVDSKLPAAPAAAAADDDHHHHHRGGGEGMPQMKNSSSSSSILDIMLAMDPPMDRAQMKAMIVELMSGGSNTTSSTLEWAMAELLNNERVMRKAVEEVDGVVGKDRMVTFEDITKKMPYIRAVVKETLRLHPPLPLLLPHYALETCGVELSQQDSTNDKVDVHRIAAGTRVLVNVWAINRDEKTWGSTANEFAPERFLGFHGNGFDLRGQNFGLLPFGSGRRICPGLGMAAFMLELTIATFLHCFEWKKSEDGPVDMSEEFGINVIRRSQLHALPTSFRLSVNPTLHDRL